MCPRQEVKLQNRCKSSFHSIEHELGITKYWNMKFAFIWNVQVTNSWIWNCTLTVTCSNVKTEINFGHVLWFPTFATLTLRFISREFPLQLSAGANKTFSSKVQGAGRGFLWWVTGSCPPVCPLTTRARTTDPTSGGETLTLLYLILMFTNCFIS